MQLIRFFGLLGVSLLLATSTASAESKEIEGRLAEIDTLDKAIAKAYALAISDPAAIELLDRITARTAKAMKLAHPKLVSTIDESTALKRQALAAMRARDHDVIRSVTAKLRPIVAKLKPLETEVQSSDDTLIQLSEEYEQLLFQTAMRIDPKYADNTATVERLGIEVLGLRGELRRSKRNAAPTLAEARKGFATKVFGPTDPTPAPKPPPGVFERVTYAAPKGENVAYVTPARAKTPGPAILWIAGGFDWGIDEGSWQPGPRINDQSASAFRDAGLTLMLPALRGSSGNPGRNECLLGEVDDVIAAAKYLAARKDVDPKRIYLGGHSTGATLALLVAETTDMFRAVIAFGPVGNPNDYGEICGAAAGLSASEAYVRAPIEFIDHITTPTWIIEGEYGNRGSALELIQFAPNNVRFAIVSDADHFSILRPASEILAQEILADRGPRPNLRLDAARLAAAMAAKVTK